MPPVPAPKVSRRPKKRSAEHIEQLEQRLKYLPCLTERDGDGLESPIVRVSTQIHPLV